MSLNKKAQLANVYHELPADAEPLGEMPMLLWKALEKICTEEHAEAVLMCTPEMQTVEAIAKSGGVEDVEGLRKLLDEAGHIGLVEECYAEDKKTILYSRAPAFPGVVENIIVINGTPEAAEWLEKYFGTFQQNLIPMYAPGRGSMRAIPIKESIDAKSRICSYDEIASWVENSEYFTVTDCSCRTGAKLLGKACEHTYHETCIQIGKTAESYMLTKRGRQITKSEVYDILKRCEGEGLVHQVAVTEMGDSYFICNCCGCHCAILRNCNLLNLAEKSASNFVAEINPDNCVGCGACVEACNMNALSLGNCFSEPIIQTLPDPSETEWTEEYWDKDYRVRRMVNEQGTSPCKTYCPAHISVQGYIKKAGEGKYGEALKVIKRDNPFPAVCGRICPHNCESECSRGSVDEALAIDDIKKFIADKELDRDLRYVPVIKQKINKRVAVIGAGPAGLSCAYYLAADGFSVTVFEKEKALGGMLKFGMPSFRLEKDVIDAEIDVLNEMGVRFVTGVEVGKDISLQQLRKDGYEAFYLAIGAQKARKLGIEGETAQGVQYGVEFLRRVNLGELTSMDGSTVVIGGGNVAVDVARSAVRLTGESVRMFCLEKDEEMPTVPDEKNEAIEEGIEINNSWAPDRILTDNGKVCGVRFVRCSSVYDENGRFSPVYNTDEAIEVECSNVLISIGQAIDWGNMLDDSKLSVNPGNILKVNEITLQAEEQDVFGGGDAVTGPKFTIDAIATGKKGAISIRRFLLGQDMTMRREREYKPLDKANLMSAGFDRMPRQRVNKVDTNAALKSFRDLRGTLTEEQVKKESKRCLHCGVTVVDPKKCIGCGVCTTKCEFDAVKLKKRYEIDVAANIEEFSKIMTEYNIEKMTKIATKKAAEAEGQINA